MLKYEVRKVFLILFIAAKKVPSKPCISNKEKKKY